MFSYSHAARAGRHRTRFVFVGLAERGDLATVLLRRDNGCRTPACAAHAWHICGQPRMDRSRLGTMCGSRLRSPMRTSGRHGAVRRLRPGGVAYAVLGILVGVLNLSELKAVMNRRLASDQSTQSNHRDARPQRAVGRGHHQHAIVIGRRYRLVIVVPSTVPALAIIPGLRNDAPP